MSENVAPTETPLDGLQVNEHVTIPRTELDFRATRGGGPGGQHVNTSSTRIELWWDVSSSSALTSDQRKRVMERLSGKLDRSGRLRIVAGEFRSQQQNRAAAERRLVDLIGRSLVVPRVRRKTKPSRASKEARLQAKKRRSERKRERRTKDFD